MPNTKGSAFAPRISFIREKYSDRYAAFLTQLSPATRETVERGILKSNWYPFEAFVEINVVADRMFGHGDLGLVREMGRYAAEVNLPTLYRVFLQFGSPDFILRKGATLWSQHHDSGEARLVPLGRKGAEYQVHKFATPHPAFCATLEGWIARALELAGAREVSVSEVQCAVRGRAYCAFTGRWG